MGALFETILGSDAWAGALAVVLDAGAKSIILLVLAWVVALAMRRSSAAARHLVWTLAMVGLLALPVLSILMPKWQIPILPRGVTVQVSEVPVTSEPEPVLIPSVDLPRQVTMHRPEPVADTAVAPVIPMPQPTEMSVQTVPVQQSKPTIQITLVQGIFVGWLLISFFVLAPLLAGMWAVGRLQRRTAPFTSESVLALLSDLTKSLGIRSSVQLHCAGEDTMPMAAGILGSVVFLPGEAEQWAEEKRRVVLLHELAHVKRRDCLTHALARVALSLYWFNPLAWMALRFQRIERERACDDLVLTAGEQPSVYADQLLEIARSMRTGSLTSAAAITMAKRSQLEGRLLAVLDPRRNRRSIKWWAAALGGLLLMAVSIPLGMTELSAREETAKGVKEEAEVVVIEAHTAIYENGLTATVVAIAEDMGTPNRKVWAADGTALDKAPDGYTESKFKSYRNGYLRRDLYVQVDKPEGTGQVGNTWRVDGEGGRSNFGTYQPSDETKDYLAIRTIVKPGTQTSMLRLGLAAGPWETVYEGAIETEWTDGSTHVVIGAVESKPTSSWVRLTHNIQEKNVRAVSYDKEGKLTVLPYGFSGDGKGIYTSTVFLRGASSPEKIATIAIQARDYEYQEIPGIVVQTEDYGLSEIVYDDNVRHGETILVYDRDRAIGEGKIILACAAEMGRVKARDKNGNLYKDKIDLTKIYQKAKAADPLFGAGSRYLEIVEKLKEYAAQHTNDPDYGWRIWQLCAVIMKDHNELTPAIEFMEKAMREYPEVTYSDPSKHSKYQHLVNQTCELVWMRDGMEAAEAYLVKRWNQDPKFVYFFALPWEEWYRQNGQSLDRLDNLKSQLKDKSRTSVALSREAPLPDFEELSKIHDEAKLTEIRDLASSSGDVITACMADIQRVKVRGENGNLVNGEFYHKDRIHLTVSIPRLNCDDPDDLVAQLEELASQHTDDPEYGWRIWHLCADIMDEDGNLDSAIHYMKKSVEAYPYTTYSDPKWQSLFQHLVDRLCMMIWDQDGREIAEAYLINCWRSDPRFVYFVEYSWKNRYKNMDDPARELQRLKVRMGEKPSLDHEDAQDSITDEVKTSSGAGWGEKVHGVRTKLEKKPLPEDTEPEGVFQNVIGDFHLWVESEKKEMEHPYLYHLERATFQIDGVYYITRPIAPGDHWGREYSEVESEKGSRLYQFFLKIQDDMVLVQPYTQYGDYISVGSPVKLVVPIHATTPAINYRASSQYIIAGRVCVKNRLKA